MPLDQHAAVLTIVARVDQLQNEVEAILSQAFYPDVGVRAEELRELLVEMQSMVKEKLDQHGD